MIGLDSASERRTETSPIIFISEGEMTPCPRARKSLCISIVVVLALSITLKPIPITAQQSAEPPSTGQQASPVPKINQQDPSAHPKQGRTKATEDSQPISVTVQGPVHVVNEPNAQEQQDRAREQAKPWWKRPDWLTVVLLGVTALFAIFAFGASFWQGKSASDMVILTHRPKIIVRNIVIHGLEKLNRQTPMNQWTLDLTGYYTVANVGGLPSTIQTVYEGTWVKNDLPMERPDRSNTGRQINMSLAPGEAKEIDFGHFILSEDDACDLIDGTTHAYFLVRIKYIDRGKVIRETSACRKFDHTSGRFVRVTNRDYEYAD